MSENMYRDKVARITKERAALEKAASREAEKVAKAESEIGRLGRSISRTSSQSTVNSNLRRIESKQKEAVSHQKKLADLQGKIGRKASELAAAQKNLDRAVKQRVTREEAEAKKRRREELSHARQLTREAEKQAALFAATVPDDQIRSLPPKITVLFLAASPVDQVQLRLDEEVRAITEKIRAAEHRDSVELVARWALRTSDLMQHLNEHQPHIVHFSGHGSDQDELAFHKEDGTTKLVTKEAISAAIATAADNIELIVFNACYSRGQAEAVTQHIDAAIGMTTTIGDEAARVFSAQFYSALSFGKSIRRAFEQAQAQLLLEGIPEADTPELFVKAGLDPDEIVLVRPAGVRAADPRPMTSPAVNSTSGELRPRLERVADLVADMYAIAKKLQDEKDAGLPLPQLRSTATSLSAKQAQLRTALVGLEENLSTARNLGDMDHSPAGLGMILRGWLTAQDEVHKFLIEQEGEGS